MASAAPPKRMVSSVFITLASPYRATMTQQQPALQAHSAPAHDSKHAAVRVSPTDNIQSLRLKKEDHSQAESYGGADRKGRTRVGSSSTSKALHPQSPQPSEPGPYRGKLQQHNRGTGTWNVCYWIYGALLQNFRNLHYVARVWLICIIYVEAINPSVHILSLFLNESVVICLYVSVCQFCNRMPTWPRCILLLTSKGCDIRLLLFWGCDVDCFLASLHHL